MTPFDPYWQWLGIPPHEQPADHYRLLGLRRFESDPATIGAATDHRMALIRTYQTGPRGDFTQRILNHLAAAKLCLLDPYSKAEYDATLAAPQSGAPADNLLPASLPTSSPAGLVLQPTPAPLQTATRDLEERRFGGWVLITTVVLGLGVCLGGAKILVDRRATADREKPAPASQPSVADDSATGAQGPSSDRSVVLQEASGFLVFPMSQATLSGRTGLESHQTGDFLVGWQDERDTATWPFRVLKLPTQGIFRVRIMYQADRGATNARYVLRVDGEELIRDIRAYDRLVEDEFYLAIKGGGEHSLQFLVRELPLGERFGLKLLEFSIPAR